MAFPSVTAASPANIKAAGFQAVYIKDASSGVWQTLGAIADGSMNIKTYSVQNSVGQNKTQGALEFTAKCKMLQCGVVELELLDSICDGTNAFLFKLSDYAAIPTGGATATIGWVTVSATQVGCKGKVVADGDPSNNQHIELEWQGSLLSTELDAAVKAAIDDDDFASTATTATFCGTAGVGGIGTYSAAKDGGQPTNANIKACGVSTVTITDVAGGGAQTIGPVTNAKISFDMLAVTDSRRRFLPNSLDVMIEYDWLQTDAADLLLLDSMMGLNVTVVVTMLNGVIFTLTNQVGLDFNFETVGDFDKSRLIRFTHKGKILQSSFDGIVSA